MPLYRTEDGHGVYGEASMFVVEDLRDEGFAVAWLDEPDRRLYSAKRSAELIVELAIQVATGVASSAVWAILVKLFARKPYDTARVHLEIHRETRPDGSRAEMIKYDGPGAEVSALLARDQPPSLPRAQDDD